MRYGIEKEYFLLDTDDNPVVVNSCLPHDECGWLLETRTKVVDDVRELPYQVDFEEDKLIERLVILQKNTNTVLRMTDEPVMVIPNAVRIEARRRYSKGVCTFNNLYGHKEHRTRVREATAGLHVNFTQPKRFTEVIGSKEVDNFINQNFDWVTIIRKLDEAFAEEIRDAKRRPGFYDVKYGGRIEYRSLPANVDLKKLVRVLRS